MAPSRAMIASCDSLLAKVKLVSWLSAAKCASGLGLLAWSTLMMHREENCLVCHEQKACGAQRAVVVKLFLAGG